ncbi:putative dehydrogenase [Paenarthrobacter nicotinovorans]|uniref:Gfo/Idh/MocA family protein n=1 Tax=Paenarthrobacter nicotinovorans TaxID=29320 RepID=UPI0027853442|nr:Gfo/Idh/MocA family oxidoreductase [Paenarthrobacter nicotinovorans]MDP9933742.1 putative dehydrogenase [Paenarthrobacter nicotinovorans]
MTNQALRLGILGAGMIATGPLGYLAGMPSLAGRAEVTAIASRTLKRAQKAAAEYSINNVYDNLDDMLRHGDVDAVINATSIEAHYETSKAVLAAGKHLVSEKPFTRTENEANELTALAAATSAQVVVAPFRMLEPSRKRAAALIRDGAIGIVHSARVRVSHAGPGGMPWPSDPRPAYSYENGPLRDLSPYAFDQILGLLGPVCRLVTMTAVSRPVFQAYGRGPYEGVDVNVASPDIVTVMLETAAGCVVTVDASYGTVLSSAPNVELYGTDGTINLHTRYGTDPGPRIELHRRGQEKPGAWIDPSTNADHERERVLNRLGRAALVEHLLDALDSAKDAPLNARYGTELVRLISAAESSADKGRVVELK